MDGMSWKYWCNSHAAATSFDARLARGECSDEAAARRARKDEGEDEKADAREKREEDEEEEGEGEGVGEVEEEGIEGLTDDALLFCPEYAACVPCPSDSPYVFLLNERDARELWAADDEYKTVSLHTKSPVSSFTAKRPERGGETH